MEREEDWQVVTITPNFWIEVDCNSGRHRRVHRDGTITLLDY